jgi:hypothetical protein
MDSLKLLSFEEILKENEIPPRDPPNDILH